MAETGLFILTGGPGAGKTSVLDCLHKRGYLVMPESARQVIIERRAQGLPPRPDPEAFAREILSRDVEQYQ